MNPGSWLFIVIGIIAFVIGGIICLVCIAKKKTEKGSLLGKILITITLSLLFVFTGFAYERDRKVQEITKITAYNEKGEIIKVYEGDFEVERKSTECVVFTEENGTVHELYISGMLEIEHIKETQA